MAYNQHLAERIALELERKHIGYETRKMFGGICYMVDDKMCVGVVKDALMARTDPAEAQHLLAKPGASPMDFTRKSMKGFLFIDDDGWDSDDGLSYWIDKCLEYNPLAKSSK
jgi:TfoX/Sxy family transcriptional regulator of competence genes